MSASKSSGAHGRGQVPLAIVLIFGPVAIALGLLVFGLVSGHVPAQAGATRVPAILLWLTGLLFTSAGMGLLLSRLMPATAAFFGVIAFCTFVGIFNWIAFGPGDRDFQRSTTTSAGSMVSKKSTAASETEGRLVFGLFAGALDLLILYGFYHGLKHRRRGAAKPPHD